MKDFTQAIRRAVQTSCNHDFLAVHRSVQPLSSRVVWLRLNRVLSLLRTGKHNASSLSQELGTCTKSIYRDIHFLRAQFGLSIVYMHQEFRFQVIE